MCCHFVNSAVICTLTFWVCFETAIQKLLCYEWTGCTLSEDTATDVDNPSSQNTSDDISDMTYYSSTDSSTGGRIRYSSSSSNSSDSMNYYISDTSESCSPCYSTSDSENLFTTPPLHSRSRQVQFSEFTNRIHFSGLWNGGSR